MLFKKKQNKKTNFLIFQHTNVYPDPTPNLTTRVGNMSPHVDVKDR